MTTVSQIAAISPLPPNNGRWQRTEEQLTATRQSRQQLMLEIEEWCHCAKCQDTTAPEVKRREAQLRAVNNAMLSACEVCGILLMRHATCDCCGILIGPSHIEPMAWPLGKLAVCGNCSDLYNRSVENGWSLQRRMLSGSNVSEDEDE